MSVHDTDKYAEVKRILEIPEDEPIFILRSQDRFAPLAVEDYAERVFKSARRLHQHEINKEESRAALKEARIWNQRVIDCATEMYDWQEDNPDKVKIPD